MRVPTRLVFGSGSSNAVAPQCANVETQKAVVGDAVDWHAEAAVSHQLARTVIFVAILASSVHSLALVTQPCESPRDPPHHRSRAPEWALFALSVHGGCAPL